MNSGGWNEKKSEDPVKKSRTIQGQTLSIRGIRGMGQKHLAVAKGKAYPGTKYLVVNRKRNEKSPGETHRKQANQYAREQRTGRERRQGGVHFHPGGCRRAQVSVPGRSVDAHTRHIAGRGNSASLPWKSANNAGKATRRHTEKLELGGGRAGEARFNMVEAA